MKAKEEIKKIKDIDKNKLFAEIEKERASLNSLKLSVSARKEDNTSKVKKSKKYIARMMTMVNEKDKNGR